MSQVPLDARREVKFVANEMFIAALYPWLRLHRACFTECYEARWINNIYFDTVDCKAYADNLSGISVRNKVRYRWYGVPHLQESTGTLEIKRRRNCYGWKLKYPAQLQLGDVPVRWLRIKQALVDSLSADGRQWLLANPCPILFNRYYRRYFLSGDKKIRITLDTQHRVYDQRTKSLPNLEKPAMRVPVSIVEIKFNRMDQLRAASIIQGIPIRVSRNSKYATGVASITGH